MRETHHRNFLLDIFFFLSIFIVVVIVIVDWIVIIIIVGRCLLDCLCTNLFYRSCTFIYTHENILERTTECIFFFFSLNNIIIMNVIIWVTFHYNMSVWRHSSSLSLAFRSFSIYSLPLSLSHSFAYRHMLVMANTLEKEIDT